MTIEGERADMPADDKKRAAHRALVDSILSGPGRASADQRAAAFAGAGVDPAVQPLVDKVATNPTQVSDADFAAAKAAGLSEDQIVELVIAAAVGQSTRMYEAGLAALDEVSS
jgi:alkylhydroperoxidase family enzyme